MKIGLTKCVNDPIAAFKFYTEIRGFENKFYMPEALLGIVVSPEEPDGTAVLLEPNSNFNGKEFQQSLYNGKYL